jgi:hypothetical protein
VVVAHLTSLLVDDDNDNDDNDNGHHVYSWSTNQTPIQGVLLLLPLLPPAPATDHPLTHSLTLELLTVYLIPLQNSIQ